MIEYLEVARRALVIGLVYELWRDSYPWVCSAAWYQGLYTGDLCDIQFGLKPEAALHGYLAWTQQ